VQAESCHAAVAAVLTRCAHLDEALAVAEDGTGRRAVDIAAAKTKRLLQQCMFLFRRYELLTSRTAPHHTSATCVVHLAVDHGAPDPARVALKFMRDREQFEREISARQAGFDDDFVINIEHTMDGATGPAAADFVNRGFGEYPYLVVMAAGDRSLADVIAKEHLAGQDFEQVHMPTPTAPPCTPLVPPPC